MTSTQRYKPLCFFILHFCIFPIKSYFLFNKTLFRVKKPINLRPVLYTLSRITISQSVCHYQSFLPQSNIIRQGQSLHERDPLRLVYTMAMIALSQCILNHKKYFLCLKKPQLIVISPQLQDSTLRVAFLENIELGCKLLTVKNTLAYEIQNYLHNFPSTGSGRIQTLNLSTMSKVFNHCASG